MTMAMTTEPPGAPPDEGGDDVLHAVSHLQGLLFAIARVHGINSVWWEMLTVTAEQALQAAPDGGEHSSSEEQCR